MAKAGGRPNNRYLTGGHSKKKNIPVPFQPAIPFHIIHLTTAINFEMSVVVGFFCLGFVFHFDYCLTLLEISSNIQTKEKKEMKTTEKNCRNPFLKITRGNGRRIWPKKYYNILIIINNIYII